MNLQMKKRENSYEKKTKLKFIFFIIPLLIKKLRNKLKQIETKN